MITEILAVGTELLMGQIANTNAQYISNRLPEMGIGVYFHSVVGDNPKRLKDCLNIALDRADLVIMTGGLGPTQDDLTKETVAAYFSRKLVLHQPSLDRIKDFFGRINRIMTENNIKQAYMPEDCVILQNDWGTAPGCIIDDGKKIIVMLPGPPSEMKPMFEARVVPYLKAKTGVVIKSRFLKVFGIGESSLEALLKDMIDTQTNPTIAPYAKEGEVTLRITARADREDEAYELIKPVEEEIRRRTGIAAYGTGDQNMEDALGELLLKRNKTIAVAESCTGGLVADRLTNVPGISRVFDRGVVSYSNQSKMELLGVKKETLDKFGAVSEQTVIEMAEGVRKLSGTDIGLSISGIAGPDGGTPEKPVGTVYVGISAADKSAAVKLQLTGSRLRIKNSSALNAMNIVRKYLLEN